MITMRCMLCAIALLFFACRQKEQHPHQPTESRSKIDINDLLSPVNQTVIANVESIAPQRLVESKPMSVTGTVSYNPNFITSIAVRTGGRIERLYVRYNYQPIQQGDKLLELYSPELVTAQNELVFVLRNDAVNAKLVEASRQKLRLLGMSERQLRQLESSKAVSNTVTIYSSASGHIHEVGGNTPLNAMQPNTTNQTQVALKEGTYVEMGQTLFTIYNPEKLWIELNVPNNVGASLQKNTSINMSVNASTSLKLSGKIVSVEPSVRVGSSFLMLRVEPDNTDNNLVPGQLVTAELPLKGKTGWWLPADAVIALGNGYAVLKQQNKMSLRVTVVNLADYTGTHYRIVSGIDSTDRVAAKAQFLIDNESFVSEDESN